MRLKAFSRKTSKTNEQFFESINPLAGFKDKDEFETYLYEQSNKIEPKEGEPLNAKPKHTPEALKSPGIKPPKGSSATTSHRSRTAPASKMAPKSALTSPVQKSPPVYPTTAANQTTPSSSSTAEESHFALVDISPGGHSRWLSDAGRINPAFEYTSQTLSGGGGGGSAGGSSSSPKSPVLPASTPGGLPGFTRRLPPAPLSANETRFNFPPSSSAGRAGNPTAEANFFPLSQPPAVRRRQSDKAPKSAPAPPTPGNNGTFPARKAPPIPSKSPAFLPKGHVSAHYLVDASQSAEEQPAVPPRHAEKHLPPPLPSDTLTHLIGSRSPSPRSPTVSLLVPLPPSAHHHGNPPDTALYDPSEATAPPRPPKSSTLSRNPSSASSSVILVQTEEELKPPPLPPKPSSAQAGGSAAASPSLDPRSVADPRLSSDRPPTDMVFDAPPIPPKPAKHRPN